MVSSGSGTAAAQQGVSAGKRIVGYFSSWGIYQRAFFVTDIAADKLTHINYAFANISADGDCLLGDPWADVEYLYPGDSESEALRGNFKQLQQLKANNPHLQTLISIGGWSWSDYFSDVAFTAESRQRFARSCVDFMVKYGFDGLDIDWEYPTGGGEAGNTERLEDTHNFVLLLADLRAALNVQGAKDGRHYLLTIAVSPTMRHITPVNWLEAGKHLDFINVMAYDFSGPWSEVTGFNAPLYDPTAYPSVGSGDTAMKAFVAAGVPADKLVLGVPFYGRGWNGVADVKDGLGQPYSGLPAGGSGAFEYRELKDFWLSKMERHWDNRSQVPWLYDPASKTMISYDDVESLTLKAEYVKQHGFGGVMIWELAGDDTNATLLSALYDILHE